MGPPPPPPPLPRLELERELPSVAGVLRPPVRASLSSALPDSASESSLSAFEEGLFLAARLTRERPDLLAPAPAAGVPFLRPELLEGVPALLRLAPDPDALDEARGPALPARWAPVAVVWPFGVPGPREACRARPLDVVGMLLRLVFRRGPRFGGPAELSRTLWFMIILAAGVAGAEAEPCCWACVLLTCEIDARAAAWEALFAIGLSAEAAVLELVEGRTGGVFALFAALGRRREGISSGSVKPGSPRS